LSVLNEAYLDKLEKLSQLVVYCLTENRMSLHTYLSEMGSKAPAGLLPVAYAVELALYSGHLEPYDPLSLLIIAPIGSGKTELLKAYAVNKGVVLFNDFTAYGLYTLLSQVQAGLIRHVLIADLVKLTMRGPAVWRQILMTLNALIEEGITHVETFHVRFQSPKPVKAGVIAALTTDEWKTRRKQWIRYGFLSRAIPVSYRLAPEDIQRGEESLYEEKTPFNPVKLEFPEKPVKVEVPDKYRNILKRLGRIIAAVNRDETRFRSHRHVLAMAKASALRQNRTEVDESDIQLVKALSVLWLSPYSGDEPSFLIMLLLPTSTSRIVDSLAPRYSRATIYRRLKHLEQLKVVKRVGEEWHINL